MASVSPRPWLVSKKWVVPSKAWLGVLYSKTGYMLCLANE